MLKRFRVLPVAAAALLIGLLAFVAIAPESNQALAQGEQTTVVKAVDPFTSIQINGGGTATLTFGPESSVTIEGNSLVVDRLDVKVEDGELTVGSALTSITTGVSDLTYTIVTPSIEEIHLAGTVSLDVPSMPAQNTLEIGLTTSANLTIDQMVVGSLTGKIDLLSTANLSGSADTMKMEVNNGSNLNAGDLQIASADLELNGVSKATVRVTDALTGEAKENSTVSYISQTVESSVDATSLSSVEHLPYTVWTAPVFEATPTA